MATERPALDYVACTLSWACSTLRSGNSKQSAGPGAIVLHREHNVGKLHSLEVMTSRSNHYCIFASFVDIEASVHEKRLIFSEARAVHPGKVVVLDAKPTEQAWERMLGLVEIVHATGLPPPSWPAFKPAPPSNAEPTRARAPRAEVPQTVAGNRQRRLGATGACFQD